MESWGWLTEPEIVATFSSAIAVVVLSAYRALSLDHMFKKNNDLEDLSLKRNAAIMLPIVGSISLVLFFYFFNFISILAICTVCISSSIGLVFMVYPIAQKFCGSCTANNINVPLLGELPLSCLLLYPISLFIIFQWLITGHWMLSNLIGISLVVLSNSLIRVPSIKIGALVLCGLFVYDIFWVFFSSMIFGQNVMVTVATQQAKNPAATLAKSLNIPNKSIVPEIHLPMKLVWGNMMLGLGDMVVPGLVVTYALRFDMMKGNSSTNGYFFISVIGYAIGLGMSIGAAAMYQVAQPALLYLVPCTLLPVLTLAWRRGELGDIWNGNGLEDEKETGRYDV